MDRNQNSLGGKMRSYKRQSDVLSVELNGVCVSWGFKTFQMSSDNKVSKLPQETTFHGSRVKVMPSLGML